MQQGSWIEKARPPDTRANSFPHLRISVSAESSPPLDSIFPAGHWEPALHLRSPLAVTSRLSLVPENNRRCRRYDPRSSVCSPEPSHIPRPQRRSLSSPPCKLPAQSDLRRRQV